MTTMAPCINEPLLIDYLLLLHHALRTRSHALQSAAIRSSAITTDHLSLGLTAALHPAGITDVLNTLVFTLILRTIAALAADVIPLYMGDAPTQRLLLAPARTSLPHGTTRHLRGTFIDPAFIALRALMRTLHSTALTTDRLMYVK